MTPDTPHWWGRYQCVECGEVTEASAEPPYCPHCGEVTEMETLAKREDAPQPGGSR